jgi:hypothetical protein
MYYYTCTACGVVFKRVFTLEKVMVEVPCKSAQCRGLAKRTPTGASAQIVETLDNGLMARRLERPADAERLYKERSLNDPTKNRS